MALTFAISGEYRRRHILKTGFVFLTWRCFWMMSLESVWWTTAASCVTVETCLWNITCQHLHILSYQQIHTVTWYTADSLFDFSGCCCLRGLHHHQPHGVSLDHSWVGDVISVATASQSPDVNNY